MRKSPQAACEVAPSGPVSTCSRCCRSSQSFSASSSSVGSADAQRSTRALSSPLTSVSASGPTLTVALAMPQFRTPRANVRHRRHARLWSAVRQGKRPAEGVYGPFPAGSCVPNNYGAACGGGRRHSCPRPSSSHSRSRSLSGQTRVLEPVATRLELLIELDRPQGAGPHSSVSGRSRLHARPCGWGSHGQTLLQSPPCCRGRVVLRAPARAAPGEELTS